MNEETVAEAIHAELLRQAEENHPFDAPWIDEFHDLKNTNIDGHVNLLDLARAAIAACGNSGFGDAASVADTPKDSRSGNEGTSE